VDLSTIHGPNYLNLSAKARREFLSAIQEGMNMEFSNPMERRIVTQLAMKLHNVWGKLLFISAYSCTLQRKVAFFFFWVEK
jgi:hypothetical protein